MRLKLLWTVLSIYAALPQAYAQPVSHHIKPHHAPSTQQRIPSTVASSIVFFDDFSDSRRTSLQWQETSNGGGLTFTGNSLQVNGNGTGCPRLTTHSSPFPATGDWTATFAFRYTSIATYGTTIGLGKAGGDYVACVHQDQTNQYLQMNGKNLAVRHADTDWHVVSFVKKDNTLTLYLDGAKVGADTVQDIPIALQFGGGHVDNPGQWNDQELQFVRVDRNEKVLDKTALSNWTPSKVVIAQTQNDVPTQSVSVSVSVEAPTAEKPVDWLSQKVADTREALSANQVDVKVVNFTSALGVYSIYDLAIINNSKKDILFWTTPTVVFSDGSQGKTQSGLVSTVPFRSFASQMNQAFAAVNAPSSFTTTIPNSTGKPISQAEDTLIPPGRTLYVRCQTMFGNTNLDPVEIKFKGGGWDDCIVKIKVY